MTQESFVEPPMWYINEFEEDDQTKWPNKPTCISEDELYFSFSRTIKPKENETFTSPFLDINSDLSGHMKMLNLLKMLNHSILVAYLSIIKKQMDQPVCPALLEPFLRHIDTLIEVMHKALNSYRPLQAKQYYANLLEKQVTEKEKLYEELKKEVDEANEKYKDFGVKKPMEECDN
ncbi:Mediator of RNA polymerase II transcription subunit 7 [Entamoeba marina]